MLGRSTTPSGAARALRQGNGSSASWLKPVWICAPEETGPAACPQCHLRAGIRTSVCASTRKYLSIGAGRSRGPRQRCVVIVLRQDHLAFYAMRQRNVADGASDSGSRAVTKAERTARGRGDATVGARGEQQLLDHRSKTAARAVSWSSLHMEGVRPKAAAQLSAELTTARRRPITVGDADAGTRTAAQRSRRCAGAGSEARTGQRRAEAAAVAASGGGFCAGAGGAVRRAEPRRPVHCRAHPVWSVGCAGHRCEGRRQRSAARYDRRPTAASGHRGCARRGPESDGLSAGPLPHASRATGAGADGRHLSRIAHACTVYQAAYEALDAQDGGVASIA